MRVAIIVLALVTACSGGDATKPTTPKPAITPDAAAPVAPAQPFSGKWSELTGSIKTIRVTAPDSVRAKVEAAVGGVKDKPIDPDKMRDTLAQVMQIPGVADVSAQAVQLADGVELVVEIVAQPMMKSLTAIETGGKTIPLGIGAIPNNSPLDPHRIQTLAASLRDRYLAIGHFEADVTWKRTDGAGGVDVVIEVKPGPQSTLGSIGFKGNTVAAATLTAKVAKLLVVGEPLLEEKISTAAQMLSELYWDKGYANVKVSTPKPVAGKNALVFQVTEGPQFRIGPVTIKGVPEADHAKYKKLFTVKQGDLFSRTAIADGRKKVVDAIVATGYPNAEAYPLTKVDVHAKTIALTLEIETGVKAP